MPGAYQRACADTFDVVGSVHDPWNPTRTLGLPATRGSPNGSNDRLSVSDAPSVVNAATRSPCASVTVAQSPEPDPTASRSPSGSRE